MINGIKYSRVFEKVFQELSLLELDDMSFLAYLFSFTYSQRFYGPNAEFESFY